MSNIDSDYSIFEIYTASTIARYVKHTRRLLQYDMWNIITSVNICLPRATCFTRLHKITAFINVRKKRIEFTQLQYIHRTSDCIDCNLLQLLMKLKMSNLIIRYNPNTTTIRNNSIIIK